MIAKLSKHDALRNIEDVLERRITHFVIVQYSGVSITTPEQEKCGNEPGSRDIKLLTLFGRTNGDLQWRLSTYSEGSGSAYECFPCTSIEQAKDKATALLADLFAKYVVTPQNVGYIERSIETARQFDIPVPDAVMTTIAAQARKNLESRLADRRKELAQVERELAILDGIDGSP